MSTSAATDQVRRVAVCRVEELPVGSRRIVELAGRSVGVFATPDGIFAVRNHCPHHGAPICEGRVSGAPFAAVPHEYTYGLAGRVVSCPWHHWEFDLATGVSLFDPRWRLRAYPVTVEDGIVFVDPAGRVDADSEPAP